MDEAEYRGRVLQAGRIIASEGEAPIHAMAAAVPRGVRFKITESHGKFMVDVRTERALDEAERGEIIAAAQKWMRVPGFDLTFSEGEC